MLQIPVWNKYMVNRIFLFLNGFIEVNDHSFLKPWRFLFSLSQLRQSSYLFVHCAHCLARISCSISAVTLLWPADQLWRYGVGYVPQSGTGTARRLSFPSHTLHRDLGHLGSLSIAAFLGLSLSVAGPGAVVGLRHSTSRVNLPHYPLAEVRRGPTWTLDITITRIGNSESHSTKYYYTWQITI